MGVLINFNIEYYTTHQFWLYLMLIFYKTRIHQYFINFEVSFELHPLPLVSLEWQNSSLEKPQNKNKAKSCWKQDMLG